jgi:23S rRNA (pseudouridine1915-N3)-methyltransferase
MILRLVAVGRMRNTALRAACEDYVRRCRPTLRIEVREVAEAGRSGGTPGLARRIEGDRFGAALPRESVVVALTRGGRAFTSEQFARQVGRWRQAARDVALLIGGAHGLPDTVLERAELQLSLSTMTLPHELARLVLLEQLYRAATILRGEPYHKARPV